MADVALSSVVVTGAVAISATFANIWMAERRARQSREDDLRKRNWAREDELRSVLEVASNAFHGAHLAVTQTATALDDPMASGVNKSQAFEHLENRLRQLWEQENRLAVRLGLEHQITAPFVTGVVQYQKARRLLARARDEGSRVPPEVTRLAKLAVDLQHEFWWRAAGAIGPGESRPAADQYVSADVVAREQRLAPVIEETLRSFFEGNWSSSDVQGETDAVENLRSPTA